MIKVIKLNSAIVTLCINSQIGFDKAENQDSFDYGKKGD